MKKSMLKIIVVVFVAVSFFVTACSSDGGGGSVPTAPEVVNQTGGNDTGSGVSSNPDITVDEGRIVLATTDGKISLDNVKVQLAVLDENNEWKLVDGLEITVKDESGDTIPGSIFIDQKTGKVYFVPSVGFDTGKAYTIIVKINQKTYSATVILAVDNTCKKNSMFASVPLRQKSTYVVSDLISNGKAIFGWEFGGSFRIRMKNLESGAKVMLTAFGVYNIQGHECEVYYQRWKKTQKPVEDYSWTGFTILVDNTDSSIDGPNGKPDYSFKKTYFVLKVMLNGQDITQTTKASLVVY